MIRWLMLLAVMICATGAAPFDPFAEARIDETPGARVPMDLPLVDANGARVSLAALGRKRPILLVPVLHSCPNLCGVTLDGLAAAMDSAGLEGDRDAAVVAFGIDPRETPRDAQFALGRLAERHPRTAGRIHGTVAEAATIRAVTDALGYRYAYDPRIGQYAHAAGTAVLTPDGRLSRWLYGLAPEPADLKAALGEARAGETGGLGRRLILLCYHYDPATGRYSLAIDWLLRAGGLLTATALLTCVIALRRREGQRPC